MREVWVRRDGTLAVHALTDAPGYAPAGESAVLPGFPLTVAADLLRRRGELRKTDLLRTFREGLADPA